MSIHDADRENLVAFLDGELDVESARAMEARINTDPELRAEAESLRQAWDMLDYLPQAEPSGGFTHRTIEQLEVQQLRSTMSVSYRSRWSQWAFGVVWVGALAIALMIGITFARRLRTPTDPPRPSRKTEQVLIEDLRVIEHKHLYEKIGDLEFLKKLGDLESFGDDL